MQSTHNDISIEKIIIRNLVCVGKAKFHITSFTPPHSPTGEFGNPTHFGGRLPLSDEEPEQLIARLYNAISILMDMGLKQHRTDNCTPESDELLPTHQNNITRVLTNEFFFYTNKPLTINYFQNLLQKISDYAEKFPKNIHLVLGSFAVLTPDNKVMNVVPQIECGSPSVINLIIKSNPSSIDPVYENYSNVAAKTDDISNLKITINDKDCHFSYKNIIESKTVGDMTFYNCIDICADHSQGVAKSHLNLLLDKYKENINQLSTTQLSHIVISNIVYLHNNNSLGDPIHVDPSLSHNGCKKDCAMKKLNAEKNEDIGFGTPAHFYLLSPSPCNEFSLTHALEYGYIEIAKILLNKGVDPNIKDWRGITPLGFARLIGNDEIEKRLFNKGAIRPMDDPLSHDDPIIHAVKKNNLNALTLLLQKNFNPCPHDLQYETLLYISAYQGNQFMVNLLLEYEHQFKLVNTMTNLTTNKKPLWKKEDSKIIPNKEGKTPFLIAVEQNNQTMVKSLLDNDINPNGCNYHTGFTALMQAAYNGNIEIMKMLIDKGANIHAMNNDGYTALHFASQQGHLESVKLLLKNNVNSFQKANNGDTPLSMAEANDHADIAIVLIKSVMKLSKVAMAHDDYYIAAVLAKEALKLSVTHYQNIENSLKVSEMNKHVAVNLINKLHNQLVDIVKKNTEINTESFEIERNEKSSVFLIVNKFGFLSHENVNQLPPTIDNSSIKPGHVSSSNK